MTTRHTARLTLSLIVGFGFLTACTNGGSPPPNSSSSSSSSATANSSNAAATENLVAHNKELTVAKAIYDKRCVRCHQANGEGGDVQIEDVSLKVPSFKDPRTIAEPNAEWIKTIENGGEGMPKFKDKLSKEEISELVQYIRTEFQNK